MQDVLQSNVYWKGLERQGSHARDMFNKENGTENKREEP